MAISKNLEEKLKKATKLVNDILMQKLPTLEYYSDVNFKNNIKTFQKVMLYDEIAFPSFQIAMYHSPTNTLYLDALKLNEDISVEALEQIILHEVLHMASTNRITNTVGFENKSINLLYNEACTQWLTLKSLSEGNNFSHLLDNSLLYHDSVNLLNELVNELGEKIVFNHFFEADIKANLHEMSMEHRSKWIDYCLKFYDLSEYQQAKIAMSEFNNKVDAVRNNSDDISNSPKK